jgi:hypothetical protein
VDSRKGGVLHLGGWRLTTGHSTQERECYVVLTLGSDQVRSCDNDLNFRVSQITRNFFTSEGNVRSQKTVMLQGVYVAYPQLKVTSDNK